MVELQATVDYRELYETLAVVRDTADREWMLQHAVARLTRLFAADTGYIKLYDPAHARLNVVADHGIVTSAFRRHQMDAGIGLGGLALRLRQPVVTGDYCGDCRIDHSLDRLVRDEGLVTLMAAPLAFQERPLGVLYVARRAAVRFDRTLAWLLGFAGQQISTSLSLMLYPSPAPPEGVDRFPWRPVGRLRPRSDPQPRFYGLSSRQHEVLQLLARGMRQKEMADHLGLSIHTIRFHLKQVTQRLNTPSLTECVAKAIRIGLLP